jgi:hypothetical protein
VAEFRAFWGRSCEHRERAGNRATAWLCCEAAANESQRGNFPDSRENTGNFGRNSPPLSREPIEERWVFERIPYTWNREISLANRERYWANSDLEQRTSEPANQRCAGEWVGSTVAGRCHQLKDAMILPYGRKPAGWNFGKDRGGLQPASHASDRSHDLKVHRNLSTVAPCASNSKSLP